MSKLRAIALISLLIVVIGVGCSFFDQTEDISLKILDIESRRTLLLENDLPFVDYQNDRIVFGQRREFGNLSDLLLELAMLQVPPNLQPVKDGLLEVYRLESSAIYLHGDCNGVFIEKHGWHTGDEHDVDCYTRRSVYPKVTELNAITTIDELEDGGSLNWSIAQNPWMSAQLMRRTVYQHWYQLLESNGTDTTEASWRTLSAVNGSE